MRLENPIKVGTALLSATLLSMGNDWLAEGGSRTSQLGHRG